MCYKLHAQHGDVGFGPANQGTASHWGGWLCVCAPVQSISTWQRPYALVYRAAPFNGAPKADRGMIKATEKEDKRERASVREREREREMGEEGNGLGAGEIRLSILSSVSH